VTEELSVWPPMVSRTMWDPGSRSAPPPPHPLTLTKTPEILNELLQARTRGKEVDIGPAGAVQVMLTPKSLD
jgi:hypothetical protein